METPCTCNNPINLETDSLCPMCEEARDAMEGLRRERLRQIVLDGGVSNPEADNQAFADACGNMAPEDWDADNDWLASAGWGEM